MALVFGGRRRQALAGAVAAAALAVLVWRELGTAANSSGRTQDIGAEMIRAVQQGRYEEAIQIGLEALRKRPNDPFMYSQIAQIYVMRAGHEPEQSERWIEAAIRYIDRTLAANTGSDVERRAVILSFAAEVLESAGSLSAPKRCVAYGRAVKLLEDSQALLAGSHPVDAGEGRGLPAEPLRRQNEQDLRHTQGELARAGCR